MRSTASKRGNRLKKPATTGDGLEGAGEFRPSEFMRARRPELFSDSIVVKEPRLTVEVFEYHLDTLTSRKQETEFEHFCRRLAEKELCPNLLPQTGPTGGGDSKVDAETYPVAEGLAVRWYEGQGTEASRERWAFAFSAKEDWRTKVQSDVKKVAQTNRGYKLIYFLTNQFVKDKSRSEVEEELAALHQVQVRILDRSWIVKCVFEHDRLQLAVETLNLSGYDSLSQKRTGVRDFEREAELRQLEVDLADPDRYRGVEYQFAEDCLRAASLARGLELPRVEVEGRFIRAERIASKVGHRGQRLRVAYARAWTAFWWFDDFEDFNRRYDEIEQLATGSDQATEWVLLANLWACLNTSVSSRKLEIGIAKLASRTSVLSEGLEKLATDLTRPNNALWARTNRALMDLHRPEGVSTMLGELKGIVLAAKGLISFPVEAVAKIVQEMGAWLTDNEQYDDLLETVVSTVQERMSEAEVGRMLLERGFQKLRAKKKYDAIRFFGRARQKLAVLEFRGELIATLAGCSLAYESAGLLWAARASMLAATNQAASEYGESGHIPPQFLRCLCRLVWLELQLGRVPWVIQWLEVADVIAFHMALPDQRRAEYLAERTHQDRILAVLLLKCDLSDLKALDSLPVLFEQRELDHSQMALLYALGYEEYLRAESFIPETESAASVREFFDDWVEQPAASDLPVRPDLLNEEKITLRSVVLGCEVHAHTANDFHSICLAEHVLAALEALLSTSLENGVMARTSELTLNISPAENLQRPEYKFNDTGLSPVIDVEYPASGYEQITQGAGADWLHNLVLELLPRIALIDDLTSYAERIFGEEVGLSRAFNFADPLVPIKNVLGGTPKFRISDWAADASGRKFAPLRDRVWNYEPGEMSDSTGARLQDCQPAESEPPGPMPDWTEGRHRDRRVFSLINIPLWNEAKWCATVYLLHPDPRELPLVALAFENAGAGQAIFRSWRDKLGRVDQQDYLRVSIVSGIDKTRPLSYRVLIGANPELPADSPPSSTFVFIARVNRMDPRDSRNLEGFLRRFETVGEYMLLPGHYRGEAEPPEFFYDLCIGKRSLRFVPAWQLGPNDPDAIAMRAGDDPVIPKGVDDAPVLKLLKKVEAIEARRKRST